MTRAVAGISLRELLRRRVALLLVLLLPLVFYLVRLDVPWQATRMLAIGVGWAVATLALFSHVGAVHLERRLGAVGASPSALFAGRQLALTGLGVVIAAIYVAVVALTQDDLPRLWVVALLLVTTVLVSAPLGALVSFVLPRELEGALALLSVMALQLLIDPGDTLSRVLPLWSTRELATYAIDPVGRDHLQRGLLHVVVTVTVLVLVAWVASVVRLGPVRLPVPRDDT